MGNVCWRGGLFKRCTGLHGKCKKTCKFLGYRQRHLTANVLIRKTGIELVRFGGQMKKEPKLGSPLFTAPSQPYFVVISHVGYTPPICADLGPAASHTSTTCAACTANIASATRKPSVACRYVQVCAIQCGTYCRLVEAMIEGSRYAMVHRVLCIVGVIQSLRYVWAGTNVWLHVGAS